jgi:RNA polymerase sigma-70 factor, ECF subfamily
MDRTSQEDTALALAARAGDKDAFEELARRHQGRVYAVAYRVTGNREDALDVAQDALFKAFRKLTAWQPTGGFLPWLLRLTTNQAIDHVRRRKRRRQERLDETYLPDSEGAAIEPLVPGTAETVYAHEIDERVRGALHVLSESQRTVFMLRHYEGLALADIAAHLGCTVGSVKVHLFRALKKMQRELEDMRDRSAGSGDSGRGGDGNDSDGDR